MAGLAPRWFPVPAGGSPGRCAARFTMSPSFVRRAVSHRIPGKMGVRGGGLRNAAGTASSHTVWER